MKQKTNYYEVRDWLIKHYHRIHLNLYNTMTDRRFIRNIVREINEEGLTFIKLSTILDKSIDNSIPVDLNIEAFMYRTYLPIFKKHNPKLYEFLYKEKLLYKYLYNLIRDRKKYPYPNPSSIRKFLEREANSIITAFPWSYTLEGVIFWREVNDKYCKNL